jgi:hypothetical protein
MKEKQGKQPLPDHFQMEWEQVGDEYAEELLARAIRLILSEDSSTSIKSNDEGESWPVRH